MASTLTSTILFSGSKWYIVKIDIVGATSSDLSAVQVNKVTGDLGIDPSLYEIHGNLQGFTAELLWKATTNTPLWTLPASVNVHEKLYKQAGLKNPGGAGNTGDILITTSGLSANMYGSLTLKIRKYNKTALA
jgi:hypothetical protein